MVSRETKEAKTKPSTLFCIQSKSAMSHFRYYCDTNPESTSSSSSSSTTTSTSSFTAYDDTPTSSNSVTTSDSLDTLAGNIMCHVMVQDVPKQQQPVKNPHTKQLPSARSQLMELLFDTYCLLNGFFRSLLDSNCPAIQGKCKKKKDASDETAILDILQRIVDREVLVDEKCRRYPALIPMLSAINRKFQQAEGLFTNIVEESANHDLLGAIIESVQNIQNYFDCLKITNGTEKEVEADLQEILCYIEHPLSSETTKKKDEN